MDHLLLPLSSRLEIWLDLGCGKYSIWKCHVWADEERNEFYPKGSRWLLHSAQERLGFSCFTTRFSNTRCFVSSETLSHLLSKNHLALTWKSTLAQAFIVWNINSQSVGNSKGHLQYRVGFGKLSYLCKYEYIRFSILVPNLFFKTIL